MIWGAVWRGTLALGVSFILCASISAQFAPGWRPGEELPPLNPDALGEPPACTEGEIVTRELPEFGDSAWLVSPADPAPDAPAVIMVPGAGAASRDTMRDEAEALARCGIHAATVDKGGVQTMVLRDFDAWEATTRNLISSVREATGTTYIGAMGWSEGGWIVARVLDELDFAIHAGSVIVEPVEQLAWLADNAMSGLPDALRRIPATILSAPVPLGWTTEDSQPHLAATDVPMLALWGEHDEAVPVVEAFGRLNAAAPHTTTYILSGAGHALRGSPWSDVVTQWLEDPEAVEGELRGVEPVANHSVPALPESTWFTHPLTHGVISLAVVVLTVRRYLNRKASS